MRLVIGLIVAILCIGCASGPGVNTKAMPGELLEQVVQKYELDRYHSWPLMNLPPDADPAMVYFLERGNLELRYSKTSFLVRSAEFWPSKKSADERFDEANKGWDDWVRAHTAKKP